MIKMAGSISTVLDCSNRTRPENMRQLKVPTYVFATKQAPSGMITF